LEKSREAGKTARELVESGRPERNVTQFAARSGLFAIKMKMSGRNGQDLLGFGEFPDEIDHRRSTNRRR
jgi:hypothetical protein